jgi:hypothetical protein
MSARLSDSFCSSLQVLFVGRCLMLSHQVGMG